MKKKLLEINGFTLVELAIVIVIIGLLVGGVLQGQELIKQAQVRKAIKLTQELIASKNTFYAKYNAVPGDMRRATMFFDNTKCLALLYSSVTTCGSEGANGGNGIVDGNWNSPTSDPMRYWVHLALSNITRVEPNVWTTGYNDYSYYSARSIASGNSILIVAANGQFFNSAGHPKPGTSTSKQQLPNNNYFAFLLSGTWDGSILDPQMVFGIDSKVDDGKPLTGKFLAGTGTASYSEECIIGTDYNMGSEKINCNMLFSMD